MCIHYCGFSVSWLGPCTCAPIVVFLSILSSNVGLHLFRVPHYFHPISSKVLFMTGSSLAISEQSTSSMYFMYSVSEFSESEFSWLFSKYSKITGSFSESFHFPSFASNPLQHFAHSCIFECHSCNFWGIQVGFVFSLHTTLADSANAWTPSMTAFGIGRDVQRLWLMISPIDKLWKEKPPCSIPVGCSAMVLFFSYKQVVIM